MESGHVGSERERERVRSALESQRVDYPVTVTYDEAKLDAFIDTICSALHIDAIDAVVVPDVNQPVIVSESQIGRDVEPRTVPPAADHADRNRRE